MSSEPRAPSPAPRGPFPPPLSILAGVLSYLVPGLGQIVQGRVAKGLLFMVCVLAMFTAGQALGNWQNVYLPDVARGPQQGWENNPWRLPWPFTPLANLYHRWHFVGQFWIGVAAWPAIWQYNNLPVPAQKTNPFWHNFQRGPRSETELNEYLTNSDKTPDVAWVYTVIAGVLNVLVIYDAYAGAAFGAAAPAPRPEPQPAGGAP